MRDLLNNRMLQLKKASMGGQTNMTNGMDEFDESLELSKTGNPKSNYQMSNANLSRLGAASRFNTINTRPNIPKPPNMEAQKAAILDSTNHIKRILQDCNVMRTRSKKYDGPNDVQYPKDLKTITNNIISPKKRSVDSRAFQTLDSVHALMSRY